MTKVAVAMSGGVDSSVTAALMVEKYGKENVFGVTMKLFCYGEAEMGEKSCCSLDAVADAKAVCDSLGIAHYAVNLEKEFEEAVIKDFISEYKKGHTPIPCVLCNTIIKFEYLLKKVESLGADFLATGHYAQIKVLGPRLKVSGKNTSSLIPQTYQLLKGIDETKDQTYFLYGLNQEQLSKTLFPLGEMKKTEVRKIAAGLKLKTAEKKESQGICFVTEGRVTDYLAGKVPVKKGDIVNTSGEKVGEHEGVIFYTVGQRKRIGGGYLEPMYVVRIDAEKNQVVIGTKEDLFGSELAVEKMHWISGEEPRLPIEVAGKIRYNMEEAACTVISTGVERSNRSLDVARDDNLKIVFNEPQRAITPGQSLVLYEGDVVLGGGVIS